MNNNLHSPILNSMNFLNEVIERYPDAISFASGRPCEGLVDISQWSNYAKSLYPCDSSSQSNLIGELTQYGATGGLFNAHIAQYLSTDENIQAIDSDIVITNGCQEALSLCVDTLFSPGDVALISDPTYIGFLGACTIRGIETEGIDSDNEGPIIESIEQCVQRCKKKNLRPKAFYLVPDFSNPTGQTISLDRRKAIISKCLEHGIYVIEDTAYRCFVYEGFPIPSLASLDQHGVVIYIGSFSKTICPGLRIGFITCSKSNGHDNELISQFTKVKSFNTLNTPPINQAIVAGILKDNNYSINSFMKEKLLHYKEKRSTLLKSLDDVLYKKKEFKGKISWNQPEGGFFLILTLPFKFDIDMAEECAAENGVICVPISLFSCNKKYKNQIRISFSYVNCNDIYEGCVRLAKYIDRQLTIGNKI